LTAVVMTAKTKKTVVTVAALMQQRQRAQTQTTIN
jgi:hypothetical protein